MGWVLAGTGKLLDRIHFHGNNGWTRTGVAEDIMPELLRDWAATGGTIEQLQDAMASIKHSPRAVHMLRRWENKRTTGKFGR